MTRKRLGSLRRGRPGACVAALAGGLVAWLLAMLPPLDGQLRAIDRRFGDWMLRMSEGLPEREDLVFLGIDEASLTMAGLEEEVVAADETLARMKARFPWDRRVYAEVLKRLVDSGVKLVILDLVFSEPTESEADGALAEALERYRDKVVLAGVLAPTEDDRDRTLFTLVEPLPDFLDPDETEAIGFGYANFRPDADGIVREARFTTTLSEENGEAPGRGEPRFRSLAAEALRMLGQRVPAGVQEIRWSLFRERDAGRWSEGDAGAAYAPRSVRGLFVPEDWRERYGSGEFFRDKVVIIGPAAPRFQDQHNTPVGMVTGPQLHLQAMASGWAGVSVERHGLADTGTRAWLGAAGVAVAVLWVALARKPLVAGLGAVVLGVLALVAAAAWGIATFHLFSVGVGMLAFATGTVTAQSHDLLSERIERGRLTREFRRFVSRDVADALVKDPGGYEAAAAGRRRRVVVLFSDVRGFTSRSEESHPEDLVSQLNEYLTSMVAVVFRHGGTLDKFIGDAVMAHWGALDNAADQVHAGAALAAAADMIGELERLNAKWSGEGRMPFKIGIGVHFGEVIAGEIGSPERTEFGVIGDAVNLASRIEGLTKYFGVQLLVSGEAHEAGGVPKEFRPVGRVRVKGRARAVALFTLGHGAGDEAFREGLKCFEAGDFAAAAEGFQRACEMAPDDGMAAAYLRWAEGYRANPPASWQGVIVMTDK